MLELDGISKRYTDEIALENCSFSVDEGEFVTLLGPSGSGKTTALLSIAGHVTPTDGDISLKGRELTHVPPEDRSIGIVFQQDALFPHLTVKENLKYALGPNPNKNWQVDQRIAEFLSLVSMSSHASKYPDQLSGGQRRRVELARALVYQPDLLVLDEPLTGLDRKLRREMRAEIRRIHDETNVTTLYVTHDQTEALSLSDRIVLLQGGTVAASGEPQQLYEQPPNPFVAQFLGSVSTLRGTVIDTAPLTVDWQQYRFELEAAGGDYQKAAISVGDNIDLYCRPGAIEVEPADSTEEIVSHTGEILEVSHAGETSSITLQSDCGGSITGTVDGFPDFEIGENLSVKIDPSGLFGFCEEQRLVVSRVHETTASVGESRLTPGTAELPIDDS